MSLAAQGFRLVAAIVECERLKSHGPSPLPTCSIPKLRKKSIVIAERGAGWLALHGSALERARVRFKLGNKE